jgi:hypothetical protein
MLRDHACCYSNAGRLQGYILFGKRGIRGCFSGEGCQFLILIDVCVFKVDDLFSMWVIAWFGCLLALCYELAFVCIFLS